MTRTMLPLALHLSALIPLLAAGCAVAPGEESLDVDAPPREAQYATPGTCIGGDTRVYDIAGGVAVAVRPSVTGAGILDADPAGNDAGYGWHAVAYPTAAALPLKTIVWLQGSGGKAYSASSCKLPSQNLLEEAVAKGYVVLQLGYANPTSVGSICGNDPDCYGPVRQEVITGADTSTLVSVTATDSISNRLQKLTDYIKANPASFPGLTLPPPLSGPTLDLAAMRFGGHSQGGGHAAWIAQHTLVQRACFLSAVVDNYRTIFGVTRSATWLEDPFATPAGSRRDLYHGADDAAPGIEANNETMGLAASHVRSETFCPAYGCALYDPHGAIVNDDRYANDRAWACFN